MGAQRDVTNIGGVNHLADGLMLPIKFKNLDTAIADEATAVIVGVTGKKLRVMKLWMQTAVADALGVKFESAAGGTALASFQTIAAAAGSVVDAESQFGLFETAAGEGLFVDLTGTSQRITGFIVYVEVP